MVHISGYEEEAFAIFGFRIPYEELQKKWIEQEATTMLKIGESLSSNGSRALPDGFGWGFYRFARGHLGCVISANVDLSSVLRGEHPCPDFTPIMDWAKRHGVMFDYDIPKLYGGTRPICDKGESDV